MGQLLSMLPSTECCCNDALEAQQPDAFKEEVTADALAP